MIVRQIDKIVTMCYELNVHLFERITESKGERSLSSTILVPLTFDKNQIIFHFMTPCQTTPLMTHYKIIFFHEYEILTVS